MPAKTITVKVLFFGAAADAAEKREENLELPLGVTANNAFEKILTGPLKSLKPSMMFAVNQEYSEGNEILRDGDELALIPPVSGG